MEEVTKASKEFLKTMKEEYDMIPYIEDQDVLLVHRDGCVWLCGGRGLMFAYEGKQFQVRPKEPIKIPWSKLIVEEIEFK